MKISHEFLKSQELSMVFQALEQEIPNSALIVGGAVRNAILGLKVKDIDIATSLVPNEIINALKNANIRYVPTGIEHGTISAIINNKTFEITSLRKDIETDGRHAKICFTENWIEDAKRRDFSINALYCDLNGKIIDPLAIGIKAIKERIIAFVGVPSQRIKEDYLRILRLFRFFSQLPNFTIDKVALENSFQFASQLTKLSRERIWLEIKKTCNGENWFEAFKIMAENHILNELFGIEKPVFDFEVLNNNLKKANYKINETMLLARIIDFDLSNLPILQESLRLSNLEKDKIKRLINTIVFIKNDFSIKKLKIASYEFGRENVIQSLLLSQYSGDFINIIEIINNFENKIFWVNGQYLTNLGIQQSPQIGQILARLKEIWLENDFEISQNQINEIIKDYKPTIN